MNVLRAADKTHTAHTITMRVHVLRAVLAHFVAAKLHRRAGRSRCIVGQVVQLANGEHIAVAMLKEVPDFEAVT